MPSKGITGGNCLPWRDRLAMDIALLLEKSGDCVDDVLLRHEITTLDLVKFNADPLFRKKVGELREDIRDNGVTFRLKARAQAEELLATSWEIIHSPGTNCASKVRLIEQTVKWAGLEPVEAALTANQGGVSVTINLGEQVVKATIPAAPALIDVTP